MLLVLKLFLDVIRSLALAQILNLVCHEQSNEHTQIRKAQHWQREKWKVVNSQTKNQKLTLNSRHWEDPRWTLVRQLRFTVSLLQYFKATAYHHVGKKLQIWPPTDYFVVYSNPARLLLYNAGWTQNNSAELWYCKLF